MCLGFRDAAALVREVDRTARDFVHLPPTFAPVFARAMDFLETGEVPQLVAHIQKNDDEAALDEFFMLVRLAYYLECDRLIDALVRTFCARIQNCDAVALRDVCGVSRDAVIDHAEIADECPFVFR